MKLTSFCPVTPRVPLPLAGWLLALMFFCGCSSGVSAPVNVDVAKQTLKTTMETWQHGDAVDSLQKATPAIVVQDLDWTGGAKLIEFEILSDPEPQGANLIAKVKLKLSAASGEQEEKTVSYVVGTSPVLTVFRDLFR